MSHFDFLEKIAEGLFIEGYNSLKEDANTHLDLSNYTLADLEEAVADLHGNTPARGKTRSRGLNIDDEFLLPKEDTRMHAISENKPAVPHIHYCAFKKCPAALGCVASATGEGCHRTQAPRAVVTGKGVWCVTCQKAFHADCHSVYHRLVSGFEELPPKEEVQRRASKKGKH